MHALAGAFAAYKGRVGCAAAACSVPQRKLCARRSARRGFLLGVPELAALAHLPAERRFPGPAGRRAQRHPAARPASDGKPLGRQHERTHGCARGRRRALPPAPARPDRRRQVDADRAARARDFDAGRGAVVIDPKGDLVEEILARIPDGREERGRSARSARPGAARPERARQAPTTTSSSISWSGSSAASTSASGVHAPTTSSAPAC